MQVVVILAVIVALIVLPVMLAARIVRAGKTGFWSALFAVFLQACLSTATQAFVSTPAVAVGVTLIGGAVVYALALGNL